MIDNSEGARGDRVLRDRDPAPARPLRRRRLPAERRPLPPRRRRRGALRHQPRPRDALGDQPGPGRDDRPLQAARAPAAGRGGRRPRQAPQAPPPGRAEAARARATTSTARSTSSARRARRLRPLKRQAQAAETRRRGSSARSWSCAARWSPRSCASASDRAGRGRREAAAKARGARDELDADAGRGQRAPPRPAEERFAAPRPRAHPAWGLLTALRGEQERLGVRAESLGRARPSWPRGSSAAARRSGR